MNLLARHPDDAQETPHHRPLLAYGLYLAIGILLGALILNGSPKTVVAAVLAAPFLVMMLSRPEYGLLLLFAALVITTDSPPVDSPGAFAIPDFDVGPGLPQATLLLLLIVFGFFFFKRRIVERQASVVSLKYGLTFLVLLIAAAVRGYAGGSDRVMIQMDFIKFLLPVICFYLCVNAFTDNRFQERLLAVLFIGSCVKASLLCLFYFSGRGHLYGDELIVSLDSKDHLLFIMMLLLAAFRILVGQTSWRRSIAYILGAVPMLFAVIFSFRRGHWVGAVISVALMFFLMAVHEKRRMIMVGFLALLVAIPAFWIVLVRDTKPAANAGLNIVDRLLSIFDTTQHSNVHHALESQETLKDILEDPLRGLGLGSVHRPVSSRLIDWDESQQPLQVVHNTFLYLWMKLGIGGPLFALWITWRFVGCLAAVRRIPGEGPAKTDGIALGSCAGLWLALFLTGPVPFYHHQSFLIALVTAILVNLGREARPQPGLEAGE